MEVARCPCGAALTRGALACGLCHAPVLLTAEQPSPVGVAAAGTAAAPAAPPAQVGPNGFLPAPARLTTRMDPGEFSRVRPGPLSFGPLGKAVISLLLIAPVWFIWFMSGGGLVNLIFTLPTAALPVWYLSQTWRRHRIH
jgi:hypothetical protein